MLWWRFLALVVLVLGLALPVMATTVNTSGSAYPGETIQVSGTVDTTGVSQRIDLCWNRTGCRDLGSTSAGLLDPKWTTTVRVPNVGPGTYRIFACSNIDGCDSTTIQVLSAPTTTTTTTTVPTTTTTTTQGGSTTTTTSASPTTTAPKTTTTTVVETTGTVLGVDGNENEPYGATSAVSEQIYVVGETTDSTVSTHWPRHHIV